MSIDPLSDSVVIVTGASSGIGEATARALHAAGAHPVLAARRADRLERLSNELAGALAVTTDVTDAADVDAVTSAALERFGRIDGLVNNAGVSLYAPVDSVEIETFRRVIELNMVAPVLMLQQVVPVMRRQGGGSIVNISSGTTTFVTPGAGAYAATKSALNMLSAVARRELAGDGIDVSVVLPFITATEFGRSRYRRPGANVRGILPHSAEYVARVILRVLQTGEERVEIPPGQERPELEWLAG